MNLQAVHKHDRWTFGSIFTCTLMMIKPTKVDSKNYSGWPSLEHEKVQPTKQQEVVGAK